MERHRRGHDHRIDCVRRRPSAVFYYLSDSDLAAVVAYVKSAPAASHPLKPTTVGLYRNMTNDEIAAIWTYLRTIPPKPYGTR